MLQTAHLLIGRAGHRLGLSEGQVARLLRPDAEHHFEITLPGGQKHQAFRVQHSRRLGPYKGGIRFHPRVDIEEIRALALLMSLKTAALGLELGGAKGGVEVDPRQLSAAELEELSRAYVRHLAKHLGPQRDVPAPDVNTDSQVIDWMADEYARLSGDSSGAGFTGKSLSRGGSHGREAATGRGGVIVLATFLRQSGRNKKSLNYALQGFGNVGSYFATVAAAQQPGWKLVAATDSKGGVANPSGLDARRLAAFKRSGQPLSGFAGGKPIDNTQLLNLDVDILVLAALEDAITEANMRSVRARLVVELANGPVSAAAHDYLSWRGTVILPDIIANAGGVVVSYLEWQQNLRAEQWPEEKVNARLAASMSAATKTVIKHSERHQLTLKEAAFELAVQRLAGLPKN